MTYAMNPVATNLVATSRLNFGGGMHQPVECQPEVPAEADCETTPKPAETEAERIWRITRDIATGG